MQEGERESTVSPQNPWKSEGLGHVKTQVIYHIKTL